MFARLREYMKQSPGSLSFQTFMKMDINQQFFLLLGNQRDRCNLIKRSISRFAFSLRRRIDSYLKQDSLLIEIDTTILGEDCLVY
mmetsp:Transcript_22402/g.54718  ORF Transcript_22402/g.54718 Transcript_22402/m.54718 type:complete len:85 (+) Transcript_22402:93-347(+)